MRGFAVSVAFVWLVGGCAAAPDLYREPPSPAAGASTSAIEELRATEPTADTGPYQVNVSYRGEAFTMTVDDANRATEVRATRPVPGTPISVTLRWLEVGDRGWFKVEMPAAALRVMKLPGRWMRVDSDEGLGLTASTPLPAGAVFAGATQVTSATTGTYTGMLDLTQGKFFDEADLVQLGDSAKHVPFEARTRDGHLASLVIRIPGKGPMKLALSGYGITTGLTTPAPAEQTAMPPQARAMLGEMR
jgi:hypothetical protein